jgi:kojibiose phosphorylase/nigerose phosphorylase
MKTDTWKIEREGYDMSEVDDNGNRFLIGNGFIGIRGTLEEFRKEKKVACTLAGLYDCAKNQTWREPINAPNALYASLENMGRMLSHKQTLNIRHGIHSRETVYENATLEIQRFASMKHVNTICQRIKVTPQGKGVTLICGIDGDVWDINGPHLMNMKTEAINVEKALTRGSRVKFFDPQKTNRNPTVIRVSATSYEQKIPITVSEVCNLIENRFLHEDNGIYRVYHIMEPTVLERIITISHTGDKEVMAGTYDSWRDEHCKIWEELWKNSEVTIIGDDKAELSLNYSLYHLHSIAPRHARGLSIGARGLSGQVYKGAVFWDTEIFLMPFFTLTEPTLARNLIGYRIDTLPGAKRKAACYGFEGAFYPWESQEGGKEGCTDFNVIDVFTKRKVRTYFRDKQIHISGDVVYALWQYLLWTGDTDILREGGTKLIEACSDFYASRGHRRLKSDILEFVDVVGPDEYHERVENNAFTNRMAALSFELAGYPYQVRKPRIKDGIIEQFDGYFDLEDVSVEEVRSRLKHPREYWGGQGGVAFPTQIIKQADVMTMMTLFANEYSREEIEKNWKYYEPRTEHGSSLSASMYALSACRFGRGDLAYPLFLKSARADLDGGGKSWAGDVYIGGTHPAAAGGAYMIATKGFAGLRLIDDKPRLHPCLPKEIEGIEFPFIFKGRHMKARVRSGTGEITS